MNYNKKDTPREKTVHYACEEQTLEINNSTGEVTESHYRKLKTTKKEVEEDFVKLYLKDITLVYGLKKNTHNLLYELMQYANYNSVISINAFCRQQICQRLDIQPNTLTKSLKELITSEFIKKVGSNTYLLNPHLFARGTWSEIKELRVLFKYTIQGREIKTEFYEEDDLKKGKPKKLKDMQFKDVLRQSTQVVNENVFDMYGKLGETIEIER